MGMQVSHTIIIVSYNLVLNGIKIQNEIKYDNSKLRIHLKGTNIYSAPPFDKGISSTQTQNIT